MMNNQFNTTNITQHGIQMAQHVATAQPQPSAAVLNTFLNAQQQQQHQQFAAAGAIYGDPRHLQLNTSNLDKNFYTATAATLGAMGTPQRFYPSSSPAVAGVATNSTVAATTAHHPNTILITNNFSHQQAGAPQNQDHQRNIRIVATTSNPLTQTNTGNLATTADGFQHAQHVYNLNSNKQLQHLFPHILSQSGFQPTTRELLHQHFSTQEPQQNHAPVSALQVPQYYVSPENSMTAPLNSNQKIISNINANNASSTASNAPSTALVTNCPNPNNSTVVLDRINICINNLYTDSSSSASNSMASTPAQQPSPIIPAIQHKPILENGLHLPMADIYESNVLVIDEPDSTTTAITPHTPPTTPENTQHVPNIGNSANNNVISTTSSINSPSTSYNSERLEKPNGIISIKQSFLLAAQNIEEVVNDSRECVSNILTTQPLQNITTSSKTSNVTLTPTSPSSPEIAKNIKEYVIDVKETFCDSPPLFVNGEDVFIKRHDERFYLGTVIDTARNQFLVRFDDKTEIWCEAKEMRKLGISSTGNTSSTDEKSVAQPMCVSCKRTRLDCEVEICERCGRGYHRICTSETLPGSEIWLCKRCGKPMKLDETSKYSSGEEEIESETCLQLYYNLESLTWDEKHRTNAEQVYCYCGKSGKFDYNMLQCWRCLNWYHTHCTQKFIGNILRGDCFFVFCCSVCNDGNEYLRRIQASWVDIIHLILYNLSTIKKHHKYHHLQKDINPYVLEKRKMLPVPKEWIVMQEKDFLDKVKSTLFENNDFFMCGKEIKRDVNSFALRSMEPPVIIKFSIRPQDTFDDDFVLSNLNLSLLIGAPENSDLKSLNSKSMNIENTANSKQNLTEDFSVHDVYEFDDTSEDEIPIKHILDKVKKTKLPLAEATPDVEHKEGTSCLNNMSSSNILEKMDVEDDNAYDMLITAPHEEQTSILATRKSKKEQTPIKDEKSLSSVQSNLDVVKKFREENLLNSEEKSISVNTKYTEKSSRKRKAFTSSKSYNTSHLIDSSSDENSSGSSRGTSLDLIIPPPKNFLGQNNPFRIISPKKNAIDVSLSKKSVSFSIFNTTALNFSSKLAALKSAGLFPKLSTSNLVKAASQPRTVRTIKRRLSAKDITIGPNKEVRRRRTRRLSSNIEVISTTTINPIPTNFFPIQAKDLLAAAAASTTTAASLFTTQTKMTPSTSLNINISTSSSPNTASANVEPALVRQAVTSQPTHGRRLRQRPQRTSPNTSRRSSVSSNQSSTSSASTAVGGHTAQTSNPSHQPHEDLKQTVNKYFGIVNRIESGEQFSIRAKRQLPNGQMQYLIEWGETQNITAPIQNFSEHATNSQLMESSSAT